MSLTREQKAALVEGLFSDARLDPLKAEARAGELAASDLAAGGECRDRTYGHSSLWIVESPEEPS